jgi:hypothetical protein
MYQYNGWKEGVPDDIRDTGEGHLRLIDLKSIHEMVKQIKEYKPSFTPEVTIQTNYNIFINI